MVDMTQEAIRQITKDMKQYQTPSLNDKLYLHFKGWKKIDECLSEYSGVKALWLEGNGLRTLENLGSLKQLRCLYIQQNCLESLEGLEDNTDLDAINASNNSIKTISHIAGLKRLNTLQVAHNRIADPADVEELAACSTIGVLDISNNKLEDPAVLDVLARMDNLHVLQMQGNPVTRKIQHYRKTVIARCRKLTYLDDRPVFEDERRTVTAWARGGAGHKILANEDGSEGELTAVALSEALADGSFDKNKAHETEKDERKKIREEKEEKERRNREAFREMMLDARVRRVMQVLPNTRLLKDVSEAAIEELAHRMCQNPVHTNEVVGLAKDETAVPAGSTLQGLYIITRGRLQMQKNGKPVSTSGSGKLASGQYFGEVALCTAHDQIATSDMVCTDYSEIYCLTKEALMEVADLYEGTLDILQANRSQALRCQWFECKPWQAYDLVSASSTKVDRSKAPPADDDKIVRALRTEAEREAAMLAGGALPTRYQAKPGDAAWTEADQYIMELAEAQQTKPTFKMPVLEVEEELTHNPPSADLTSRPSVISWFSPRARTVKGQSVQKLYREPANCTGSAPPVPKEQYPKEWYGKHELAKSVQLPGDEKDQFGTYHYYENYGESGVRIANVDEEYNKQYARVQAARQTAFAEEAQRRGCSVAEVAAEADTLARERRARARKEMGLEAEEDPVLGDPVHAALVEEYSSLQTLSQGSTAVGGGGEEDDLPPLEDVDVTELQFAEGRVAPLPSIFPRNSVAPEGDADVDADAPPDLEDVDMTKGKPDTGAPVSTTARAFFLESDEQVLAKTGGDTRQFKTQYEKDNHATQGRYNRELDAAGEYQRGVSSKTQERNGPSTEPGDFEAADAYSGSRKGMVFKKGESGLGYYRDCKYGGTAETSTNSSTNLCGSSAPTPAAEVRKAFVEEVEEEVVVVSTSAASYGDGGIDDLD